MGRLFVLSKGFKKQSDSFGNGFDFELGNCFELGSCFSWLRDQLSSGNVCCNCDKPAKVHWALSWPSAVEICGKTVL